MLSYLLKQLGKMSKYLKERQKRLIKKVPPLEKVIRGTLLKYYLPCGKANCKCKKGYLHGPYYYLEVRTKGKNKMYYLSSSSLREKAKEGVAQYNKLWNLLCKISEINIKLLREKKR